MLSRINRLMVIVVLLCLVFGSGRAWAEVIRIVPSADGTPISYEVHGRSGPVLVFVHGWSCDARYWREQVPVFSKNYQVVTLDLAGHGHSGMGRERYTMESFGADVKAVVDDLKAEHVILIGHSMGGEVIVEAAVQMPEKVDGLIGVDTLQNVEHPLTSEGMEEMVAPLRKNFPVGARAFVKDMLLPGHDQALVDWILADMASAPPAVALSAMEEMLSLYVTGGLAKLFDDIKVPVVLVNADLWPTDLEADRRHMISLKTMIIKEADHFLMLDQPEAFNPVLEQAIASLTSRIF